MFNRRNAVAIRIVSVQVIHSNMNNDTNLRQRIYAQNRKV